MYMYIYLLYIYLYIIFIYIYILYLYIIYIYIFIIYIYIYIIHLYIYIYNIYICMYIYIYKLPNVHKSKIVQEAIQVQNSEYTKLYEPSDLTFRPIVVGPIVVGTTRGLSNLVYILLNPFLIHIKSYIKDNLDFHAKCSRETNEISF